MITQEKYVEFIKNIIPQKTSVELLTVKEYEGEMKRWYTKLGICAKKQVSISIADSYSRSVKLHFSWDSKIEELLLFCPTNKSPHKVLQELRSKISKTVNNSYTDDELIEIEKEYRADFYKGFKGSKIKKL